mgnify:FL=1
MLNSLLGRRNRKRLKYLALAYVLGIVPANYTTTAMSHDLSISDASAVVDQVKENGLVSNLTGGLNQLFNTGLAGVESVTNDVDLDTSSSTCVLFCNEKYDKQSASSVDFYTVTGQAELNFNPAPSEYVYMPLDNLGRTTGSYALITAYDRELAKTDSHPEFAKNKPADPSGWGHNGKVEWEFPDTGKKSRGYFWNRSHLIAGSLGGATVINNWVTGTRVQNVGKNDQAGGMAYTEEKVRNFLDNPANADCGVYYAAIPNYQGNELVPRTVTVDVKTCDSSINERVVVDNVMPGYSINYATGEYKKD